MAMMTEPPSIIAPDFDLCVVKFIHSSVHKSIDHGFFICSYEDKVLQRSESGQRYEGRANERSITVASAIVIVRPRSTSREEASHIDIVLTPVVALSTVQMLFNLVQALKGELEAQSFRTWQVNHTHTHRERERERAERRCDVNTTLSVAHTW